MYIKECSLISRKILSSICQKSLFNIEKTVRLRLLKSIRSNFIFWTHFKTKVTKSTPKARLQLSKAQPHPNNS